MAVPPVLRLGWDAAAVPEGGQEVYLAMAGMSKTWNKDPAGHIYHEYCLKQAGLFVYPVEEVESDAADGDAEEAYDDGHGGDDKTTENVQWKSKAKRKKGEKADKKQDLYALLGLKDIRWMATDSQLKKGYQKTALKHHPDKACAGVEDPKEKERLEEHFKLILDAYETLTDPQKRREYDSLDDFDDSLPDSCQPKDFTKVFGAAFKRQSRWSEKKPVPDLGDEDVPYEAVAKFYDFWYGFKSWREFPHPDEDDPESAECREHKRWIDRENQRLRAKAKKEETRRIREFVDKAYRLDPRVVAYKKAQTDAREARKAAKVHELNKGRLEKEAKEAEEAKARAEQEAIDKENAATQKKAKQNEQRELRKQRKRLRDICCTEDAGDGEELWETGDVEDVCAALQKDELKALCDALDAASGDEAKQHEALEAALQTVYQSRGEEELKKKKGKLEAARAEREARRAAARDTIAAARAWDDEEVRMLEKALEKFPAGVPRRWEQVTTYVRTRTQAEVMSMVKVQAAANASTGTNTDWRTGRKGGTDAVAVAAAADDRSEAFTDVCVKVANEEVKAAAAARAAAAAVWSPEQEVALVKAMKCVSKEAADRWGHIAELVPGKNKADCAKRFKELKANFKSKGSGKK